jgi:hypothetical protein
MRPERNRRRVVWGHHDHAECAIISDELIEMVDAKTGFVVDALL